MSKVYVVGHRNPDTDSICSAIVYANYKNRLTGTDDYVPFRAGQLNEETQYVLKKIGMQIPPLLQDVRVQTRDLQIRKTESIKSSDSIRTAWELMNELDVVTLPVVKNKKLEGIISTTDIATCYMEVVDKHILEASKTSYKQIAKTIEGRVVCTNHNQPNATGKVLTAVTTPDMLETNLETGDIVIIGNIEGFQQSAIEMGAGCLIICDKAPVSMMISRMASEHGCTIISTANDAFTVSRLIYQSVPVDYIMKKDNLITFQLDDYIENVRKVMSEKRHRDFPVLDKHGNYEGMISRRSLLGAEKKKLIMVDHNEAKQAVFGVEDAEILEIIDHHRLGGVETIAPVLFYNKPVGCTSTIIYSLYKDAGIEIDKEMAYLMCSAIISDTLIFRSPTCTEADRIAGKELAGIAGLNIKEHAHEMFFAGSNLSEKTAKELFTGDYKKFSIGDVTFGVGQVSCMDHDELELVKHKIFTYMKEQYKNLGVEFLYFMLTDIIWPGTQLLCVGDGAMELVERAFNTQGEDDVVVLPGVVSRKKQIVPELMMEITQ